MAGALASLVVFPQRFLYSMGIAGFFVALIAAAIALTVLPALLALLQAAMNGLGLGAMLGILVLIFQEGRFEGLLGDTSQGGLEATQLLLLFATVFGLSTDYGVFRSRGSRRHATAAVPTPRRWRWASSGRGGS